MVRNQKDNTGVLAPAFTITDWTEDLILDCDTDDANLGDVLGTLLKHLIDQGIINGTVAPK